MALILNIDTSSPVCSICLSDRGMIIAERNDVADNMHASQLTAYITELLQNNNLTLGQLSAVALSGGPGSYTGLRIGTSVAKGICYGLDIPLISVSTLEGLAHTMAEMHPDPEGIYIPMLDARRDNVYLAVYDANGNMLEKDSFYTIDGDKNELFEKYNVKNIYFGGTGASKMKIICLNNEFGTVIENLICVASNINIISYKRFIEGVFEDVTYYEPFYLKEFEGRIKID